TSTPLSLDRSPDTLGDVTATVIMTPPGQAAVIPLSQQIANGDVAPTLPIDLFAVPDFVKDGTQSVLLTPVSTPSGGQPNRLYNPISDIVDILDVDQASL